MAWTGLNLTVDGQNALNNAQLSNHLSIKSIVIGDGAPPANFRTLKGLVNQLYEITGIKIDVAGGKCTITADFPDVDYDYYFREIGIIVITEEGEKLYVYDNCGEDAQYIVNSTGVEKTRKRIRLVLNISDVAEITVTDPGILYVSYEDFEEAAGKLDDHLSDTDNPHQMTAEQLGLDPTRDMDKPVSTAQQVALNEQYAQLTAYVLQKIADLIGGAPESLDTLKEVADTIAAHKSVMDALDAAIGKKASAAEFDSHTKDAVKHITSAERTKWNNKMEKTGDSANNTVTFTSGDAANPTGWADVGVVTSGETHSSLIRKISLTIKNVRYLWKLLGSTSLAGIGDGTVTGAINELNTGTKIIAAEILLLPYTDIVYDYINPDIKNGDIAICSRYTPSVEYIGRGENTVGMLNAMDGKVRLWSSDDKGFQSVYEYLIVARSNNA
ncbi:MAG: hypothetical protein HFH87_04320 [Lachnospiraceae bacterium]|nr:hypothetical protein [Lachnospiraceae bacterium]